MTFTAPFGDVNNTSNILNSNSEYAGFNKEQSRSFFIKHGLAVRAVAIEVDNVIDATNEFRKNGIQIVFEPKTIYDKLGGGSFDVSEVFLYGDVVLRLLNLDNFTGNYLPNYEDVVTDVASRTLLQFINRNTDQSLSNTMVKRNDNHKGFYGIKRFDHIVGNLWCVYCNVNSRYSMIISLISCRSLEPFVSKLKSITVRLLT